MRKDLDPSLLAYKLEQPSNRMRQLPAYDTLSMNRTPFFLLESYSDFCRPNHMYHNIHRICIYLGIATNPVSYYALITLPSI